MCGDRAIESHHEGGTMFRIALHVGLANSLCVFFLIFFMDRPASAQPRAAQSEDLRNLAPSVTPTICLAKASEKDGKVAIRILASEILLHNSHPTEGKKGWIRSWTEQDELILGDEVRAYSPSGKKLDDQTVLKALSKEVPVASFARTHKNDPELPDKLYTSIYREDLVILVYEAKLWLRKD